MNIWKFWTIAAFTVVLAMFPARAGNISTGISPMKQTGIYWTVVSGNINNINDLAAVVWCLPSIVNLTVGRQRERKRKRVAA
jgi:hypothetical protein